MNPYAQGGWYNPSNPHTINTVPYGGGGSAGPSIFGALPRQQGPTATVLTFHFVCWKPDPLSCMITGPNSVPYLEVATVMNGAVATTVFRKSDGRVLAAIEWGHTPTVEIQQILPKQPVAHWLRASGFDRTRRAMNIGGKEVNWVTLPTGTSAFSYAQPNVPLVRIHKGPQAVTLELTTEAANAGLLEASIITAVLLNCGRNID